MEFFVSSRSQRLASMPKPGSRIPANCFALLAMGLFLTAAATAQTAPRSKANVPDAPVQNTPVLKANLANSQASFVDDADSTGLAGSLPAGDISLYTVVDLALRNSKKVQIAEVQEQIARGAWKETRDAYVPNLQLGSGLGYSYGFPLGQPTIFTVSSTSLLYSFSQHDYIRSTQAATKAATLSLKNIRQQVILDATLNYIDLTKTLGQIAALNQATADTDKLVGILGDRVNAGVATRIQLTRAQLTGAQIKLRALQMEDHADELRQHLSQETGLDPALIEPVPSSVPSLPDLNFPSLLRTSAKPPAVLSADATADSKMFAAKGDEKQNYRPTIQLASQYALFSTFNNYQQYYNAQNFQINNFGLGIQAVWPLFDRIRRDKSNESEAEAVRARQQAELARIQNDEGNLALWHSLRELEAQEQVAALQQQLAKDTLASAETQMNQGGAGANSAPVTPQQAEQQRIEERTSYVDLADAQFNVTKVKLDLLNAVGGLEDWAKEGGPANVSNNIASRPTH